MLLNIYIYIHIHIYKKRLKIEILKISSNKFSCLNKQKFCGNSKICRLINYFDPSLFLLLFECRKKQETFMRPMSFLTWQPRPRKYSWPEQFQNGIQKAKMWNYSSPNASDSSSSRTPEKA